jgi:hypothetical protein
MRPPIYVTDEVIAFVKQRLQAAVSVEAGV